MKLEKIAVATAENETVAETVTSDYESSVKRWAATAGSAGAMLPKHVEKRLLGLSTQESVTQTDVLVALSEACQDAYRENGGPSARTPDPRGLDIEVWTRGDIRLVWRGDTTVTTLQLGAQYSGLQCPH